MSYIVRRGLSTLIPPKVASPKNLGAAPNAKRMNRVVNFYKSLPQGPAPKDTSSGPISWYRKKYLDTGSAKPILHVIGAIFLFGYANEYVNHFAHGHEEH